MIEIDVPDGTVGQWTVETFEVTRDDARSFNLGLLFNRQSARRVIPGTYKRLRWGLDIVMSNTPAEIADHAQLFVRARSANVILLNGLGLGMALKGVLEGSRVQQVIVVERSAEVIQLVAPTYTHDPRVTIVHADALTYKPIRPMTYDVVWHDIWSAISEDNLPEMFKLHRRYGHLTQWQGSWCRQACLLARRR